jgi:hypothetical protein
MRHCWCFRERVASIAQGGVILVAWADFRYLDLTINWLHHMHLLKITSYMVGAWDDELLKVSNERYYMPPSQTASNASTHLPTAVICALLV